MGPATPGTTPPHISLQVGDSVDVPTVAQLQKTVLVAGAVSGATPAAGPAPAPGEETGALKRLPYVEGDTVRSLLLRAGGALPAADLAHSALVHANGTAEDVNLEALLVRHELTGDRPLVVGDTLIVPDLAAATKIWRELFPSPEEVYTEGFKFMKKMWAEAR